MKAGPATSLYGLSVADVMLATPKTLPVETTVAEAREALVNDHVQMLLFTEGAAFRGAVTGIPEEADPSSPALDYVDATAETIAPTASAEVAYEASSSSPHRRIIVLDAEGALLGLVCLNPARTRFCTGRPGDDCR